MHFGLRYMPSQHRAWHSRRRSEYQYSIPLEQLKSGHDMRCVWCALVYEQYLKRIPPGKRRETVKIEMVWRHSGDQYDANEDSGMFYADAGENLMFIGLVCTAPGASKYIQTLSSRH